MWTSDCLTTKLKRLTCQGDIQDQIRSRFHIRDNSVSPTTRNLWTCSESVEELISGKLTERFKTNDEPRCLCVTSDEHILVGTKHRISEYTPDGKPGITTEISLFKKAVVCSPWRISQCPLSDNVAVVDRDEEKDGGKDKPAVIVLDRQLQHLYRYGESQHNSMTNCQCFDPWDLTYDSQRFLVVADYKNKHLHLLSGDGQYLRLLHTDIDCPRAVCVDTEGVLWAVFGLVSMTYQKVKRLQYTGF
ncbi:uncharacterized protein LOC110444584 [Mizuhopecten yessoensis]|uniref:uncharacterized protein LOC110444584 n=1 Tax=Mizuhopecten yessoensis TaxID=6573 RepID=UPI000B4597CB|nr:uncharacterized protein LOC110444584 [Mizuhopecten yessoensis]